MAIKVTRVYEEQFPRLRFIGLRYTEADRGEFGGYSRKWEEWFQKGLFDELEKLGPDEGSYIALMREESEFEYWIGMFFPEETPVPEGLAYIDLRGGSVAVAWVKGNESGGEIFGMEACNKALAALRQAGLLGVDAPKITFERYNCPRFTEADANGDVILDYGFCAG